MRSLQLCREPAAGSQLSSEQPCGSELWSGSKQPGSSAERPPRDESTVTSRCASLLLVVATRSSRSRERQGEEPPSLVRDSEPCHDGWHSLHSVCTCVHTLLAWPCAGGRWASSMAPQPCVFTVWAPASAAACVCPRACSVVVRLLGAVSPSLRAQVCRFRDLRQDKFCGGDRRRRCCRGRRIHQRLTGRCAPSHDVCA